MGQTLPNGENRCLVPRLIDFELETAFITTDANIMGETIPINEARITSLGWYY
jgi:fumarylacetoacetase